MKDVLLIDEQKLRSVLYLGCALMLAEPPRLHQCKAADDVTGSSDEGFDLQRT